MNLLSQIRSSFRRSTSDWLAVFFLALWSPVLFWQEALRQTVFSFGDIFLFFYPTRLAYANALREGRLPLWEPKMLAGFPLFAEGQIGALYPTHPLLYGLLPVDIATNWDILFHLSWVAVGTYLFARVIKLQPASAFLAAFAFATGGFFYARLQHMSVLATAAWLPWLLWAWEKFEREPVLAKRLRWFVLLALMSGTQLLGGHPQFAFSSALLIALYAAVRWKRDETPLAHPRWLDDHRYLLRAWNLVFEYFDPVRLLPLGLFFFIGAALAAVQLMPTFELAGFTNRASGLDARFFNAYSLRLPHFLMLFSPFLLGNPYPFVSVEVMGYVGALTLFLAIAAPFVRRDRRVLFFVVIALSALFLGLGDQNVFYRALRHLPLFNYFRVPSRFLFWYTFAAAMLAGIAFDWLLARAPVTPTLTRGQKVTLAIFFVVIATIVGLIPSVPLSAWLALWVYLPLVLGLFAVWVILGARRGLFTRTTLMALVLGITVADLALFAAVYDHTYDSSTSVADFYQPPDVLSALKGLSPQDGRVLTSTWIIPWQQVERASLYPNISLIYGIPSAIGYTPLLPQRMGDILEEMGPALFNLMNIRYYLIPQMLPTDSTIEAGDTFNPFALDPIDRDLALPPTPASKIEITSAVSQSTDWKAGEVVADIYLSTADGRLLDVPLRLGTDTAEWAFERSDVRRSLPYAMPTPATSFPASSSFPPESHLGHTFLAQVDLATNGPAPVITGMYVYPKVNQGLLRIERVTLISPEGTPVSVAHLVGRDDQYITYRSNDVVVYENPDALPRAFIVHQAVVVDDATLDRELYRRDWNPQNLLYLSDGEPLQAGDAQRPDEQVRIVEYGDERVVLSVHASADGYVFLSDAWFPGWTATVDGVAQPIRRADSAFRAIRVTPGDHRIEMEYHPSSLLQGALVSLLGWVTLFLVYAWSRRVRRVRV